MNETMKASPELVMAIRDLAREDLRARWISNVQQEILFDNNAIAENEKSLAAFAKEVAQINYNISKLDEANPSYAELLAKENASLEIKKKLIEYIDIANVNFKTSITDLNASITKIVAGESKVDAENLNVKAKELIEKFYASKVTEIEA